MSFAKDVLPIFQQSCTRWHGGNSRRAGLSLEDYAKTLKGAASGPVVIAGDPDKSEVYTLSKSGAMPFGGQRLADGELQRERQTIDPPLPAGRATSCSQGRRQSLGPATA